MTASISKTSSGRYSPLAELQQTRSNLDTPYTLILENIKNQISELVNPFLADDINRVFEQIGSNPSLDAKEGVKHLFNTLPLPKEINDSLTQLDTHVQGFLSPEASTDEILKQITHFQSQVSDLYKNNNQIIKEKTSKFIKEKKILYQIPEIQKIHSVAMRAMDSLLSTKLDFPINRTKIKRLIKKEAPNIDNLISIRTNGNYKSLIEIIKPILKNNKRTKKELKKPKDIERREFFQAQQLLLEKLSDSSQKYFEFFFKDLLANKLTKLSEGIIAKNDLVEDLKKIQFGYKKFLSIEKTFEEILKETIIRVIYSKIFKDQKFLDLLEAYELLQKSNEALKPVTGKDVTLLVGHTGSGKSSFAGYLLGANIILSEDNKVKYSKKEQDTHNLPKIFHEKTISGTEVSTGYTRKDKLSWGLVDCTGFDDTRGNQYEIATHLAINNLTSLNAKIKSVVVVAKLSDFASRPPKFLETVEKVRTIFNFAFRKDRYNSNIFLLITHNLDESLENTAEEIITGELFQNFANEINKQNKKQPSKTEEYQHQVEIWESMIEMSKRQIDIVDIEDSSEVDALIKKYHKKIPIPIAKSESDKDTFKTILNLSISTWTNFIYKQFYIEIPASITFFSEEIEKLSAKKTDLKQESTDLSIYSSKITDLLHKNGYTSPTFGTSEIRKFLINMKESKLKTFKNNFTDIVEKNFLNKAELRFKCLQKEIESTLNEKEQLQKQIANDKHELFLVNAQIQALEQANADIHGYSQTIKTATRSVKKKVVADTMSIVENNLSGFDQVGLRWLIGIESVIDIHEWNWSRKLTGKCLNEKIMKLVEKLTLSKKNIKNLNLKKKQSKNRIDLLYSDREKYKELLHLIEELKKTWHYINGGRSLHNNLVAIICRLKDIKINIESKNEDLIKEIDSQICEMKYSTNRQKMEQQQLAFFIYEEQKAITVLADFCKQAIKNQYVNTKIYHDFLTLCKTTHPNIVKDAVACLKINDLSC